MLLTNGPHFANHWLNLLEPEHVQTCSDIHRRHPEFPWSASVSSQWKASYHFKAVTASRNLWWNSLIMSGCKGAWEERRLILAGSEIQSKQPWVWGREKAQSLLDSQARSITSLLINQERLKAGVAFNAKQSLVHWDLGNNPKQTFSLMLWALRSMNLVQQKHKISNSKVLVQSCRTGIHWIRSLEIFSKHDPKRKVDSTHLTNPSLGCLPVFWGIQRLGKRKVVIRV